MNTKPKEESNIEPGKLQAIFKLDKAGYFNNLLALAAGLSASPFAAILTAQNNSFIICARHGFDDSSYSFDTRPVIADDTDNLSPPGLTINGRPIAFFEGVKIAVDSESAPMWLCVMDTRQLVITQPQLAQLNMLAKQATVVFELLAKSLMPNDTSQVERQLHEQKAFYEKILNKIPTDIAVFDASHRYLFVNPGAISVKEYRDYIIGKDDYEYAAYRNRDMAIANERRAQFLQVKQTGKEIRWEEDIKRADGTVATLLRYMFPVVEDNGEINLVIGYGIDIADRKALEEKQADLVKQLSLQNTQLVDFCNIVSHNLRAPLVNMTMLVDFMKETDDPAEHQILIEKLDPVIKNLHITFNELVESIQVKQDIEVEAETMSLQDVLERTLSGLGTEINDQPATVTCNFDEAPELRFPPKYLHSIFHNFLSNASKYRSPQRELIIDIKSSKVKGSVILQFTDNGLGIDLAKHGQKLFKIGKVFHNHADAKGFGLYMTKTQVEAMGGRIWVDSMPGEGSTFYVEFTKQGR